MGRPSEVWSSLPAAASSLEGARVAMRTSIVIHASFVSREPPARRAKPFRSEDEDDEEDAAALPAVVGLVVVVAALKGVAIIISNTRSAAARPISLASFSVKGGGRLSWKGPSSGSKSNIGAAVSWTSAEGMSMGWYSGSYSSSSSSGAAWACCACRAIRV